jgi:periplasmic protein TonB
MSDPDIEQKPSRRLWILAALAALALHVGGAALAIAHLRTNDDGSDGLGANGAEFAVEMVSPKVPDDDLPPGPEDTERQQASQEVPTQQAEPKEMDLPKDRPTEAEDPDRIVTTNDSKKPKEEDPKVAAVQTQASEYSPAQEAASRQSLDEKAPEAEKTKAPNIGIGKDRQRLTADWGRKISAYFELHKRYPDNKSKAATVKVSLVLNRRGNVVSVDVAESSGDAAFDEAALSMIRRSDPVPPPPAGLTDDQFRFGLDVKFKKPK